MLGMRSMVAKSLAAAARPLVIARDGGHHHARITYSITYVPCISGARSAMENDPIMIAKNTLTTIPASAERKK